MRIRIWDLLPAHARRLDDGGDLARFAAVLQDATDSWTASVDGWPAIFDLTRAPEPFLDLILEDLGNPFPADMDCQSKRRLAAVLVDMYRLKGTAPGIEDVLRFLLGIDAKVTAYADDTLALGESLLGEDFTLGPAGSFPRYAFDLTVGRALTPEERRRVRAVVEEMKPAHTHFTGILEPAPPDATEHWELGVSALGENADLH